MYYSKSLFLRLFTRPSHDLLKRLSWKKMRLKKRYIVVAPNHHQPLMPCFKNAFSGQQWFEMIFLSLQFSLFTSSQLTDPQQQKIRVAGRTTNERTPSTWFGGLGARAGWFGHFFSILLTHEGSHREVYQDFQPSLTSSAGGAKGWSDHRFRAPPAYTAQLLTLHQHRVNNQYRTANQI